MAIQVVVMIKICKGDFFMKNKRISWATMIVAITIIIMSGILVTIGKNSEHKMDNDKIPEGYIAVFHGSGGEQTYETYIYKNHNDEYHANSGFDYINVTSTIVSWGSSQEEHKITKQGTIQWTEDVFLVAKENNAYSFVTLPNSNKTYTIEEYMDMCLMD